MDSNAENTSCVRVTNRHLGQLTTVSGGTALLPPTQQDAPNFAVQHREEDDDEVIEVGSDSEVDEGFRFELEENRFFPPSSIDGDVLDHDVRQPAVERADPFMTPEMADEGTVGFRERTSTALDIHFGEEEEEEENAAEEDEMDMAGNNVRTQVG